MESITKYINVNIILNDWKIQKSRCTKHVAWLSEINQHAIDVMSSYANSFNVHAGERKGCCGNGFVHVDFEHVVVLSGRAGLPRRCGLGFVGREGTLE